MTRSFLVGGQAGIGQRSKLRDQDTIRFVESDLTYQGAEHFALIGAVRYTTWHLNSAPHWALPITAGVQLYW